MKILMNKSNIWIDSFLNFLFNVYKSIEFYNKFILEMIFEAVL